MPKRGLERQVPAKRKLIPHSGVLWSVVLHPTVQMEIRTFSRGKRVSPGKAEIRLDRYYLVSGLSVSLPPRSIFSLSAVYSRASSPLCKVKTRRYDEEENSVLPRSTYSIITPLRPQCKQHIVATIDRHRSMDTIRLHREHLDNALQHDCFTQTPSMTLQTGQVRVVANAISVRHKGKYISKTQHLTSVALFSLFFVAIYALGIHGYTSGLFRLLGEANKSEFLPSGLAPYRHVFTGVKPVDGYLKMFAAFFEPLAGRQDDSSYLFWVWMIPQFGVLWALMMMEHLRGGPGKEKYL